jgi:hypothetical protein
MTDLTEQTLAKLSVVEEKADKENVITKKRIDTRLAEGHFARQERRRDATNAITIWLMRGAGWMLVIFVVLLFLVGINPAKFPGSPGVKALEEIFVLMVANSKIITLIVIGYFFRDYASEMYDRVKDGGSR